MTYIQETNESKIINNATITHNYDEEADAIYEATGNDMIDEFTKRFESEFTDFDSSQDVGGVILYRRAATLVAFYDYEQFQGAVF
jgi:hypothetical protein